MLYRPVLYEYVSSAYLLKTFRSIPRVIFPSALQILSTAVIVFSISEKGLRIAYSISNNNS